MLRTSKTIQKVCLLFIGVVISLGVIHMASPGQTQVYADTASNKCNVDANGHIVNPDPTKPCTLDNKICNNYNAAPSATCQTGDPAVSNGCTNGDCSGLITKYINPLIKLLTILIGIIISISIVVAGIQYGSAAGDPSKVTAARKRIWNAVLALVAYIFLAGFLNFIIPGGLI
jgi:hypothetical protein